MAKERKAERVELLPAAPHWPPDVRQMIAEAVEEKVTEIMSSPGTEFEPWFRPQKIAVEIRKGQTVIERRRWSFFYEDWGCLVCGTTETPHSSLGMCSTCYRHTWMRLKSSMRKREKSREEDSGRTFDDAVRLAREALAGQVPALPARRTKRERGPDETR